MGDFLLESSPGGSVGNRDLLQRIWRSSVNDSVSEPATSDDKSVNSKNGMGRTIYKTSVAILLVLLVCVGILTLRVNAQRKAVQWVIDAGGNVTYRIERDENNRFLALDEMKAQSGGWLIDYVGMDYISDVVAVNLPEGTLEDLSPLGKLKKLQELWIEKNNIQDISTLSRMKDLRSLSVQSNPVIDFSPISGLVKLEKLDVTGTPIDDVSPVANLTNIKKLVVKSTKLADLKPISGLDNLSELFLSGSQVVDLTPLAQLKGLTKLSISETQVTDLSPLSELPNLETLEVQGSAVSDLTPLASVKSLRSLSTWESKVTDEAADALRATNPELKIGTVKFVFGR